MQQSAMFTFP